LNFLKTQEKELETLLFFAFSLSWIIFNWKPIYIALFSGESVENRIKTIESECSKVLYILYLPLSSTLADHLILPFVALGFERVLAYPKKWIKETQTSTLISYASEDIRLEKKYNLREKLSINNLTESLQAEVGQLQEQIQTINKNHANQIESYKSELTTTNNLNEKLN
jgi:hypothetical protein